MSSGMISTRSGYLATKLIAIADAFRSQSAWSCRKAGKFSRTVLTHSGRVGAARSSEYFMGQGWLAGGPFGNAHDSIQSGASRDVRAGAGVVAERECSTICKV